MSKFAWCTDIHLDWLDSDESRIVAFTEDLIKTNPQGIFITGDISTARRVVYHLSVLDRIAQRPIYFVLGNHDYYGGSIDDVRKQMKDLSNISPFLKYLPTTNYVPLTPTTAVLGHDGWYDALNGNWQTSNFMMNDWPSIQEFFPHAQGMRAGRRPDMPNIVALSRKLAHEGVTHVQNGIKAATRYHKNLIILTHYPPFAESHIHEGKRGDDYAQPWFTSKMMGDMLLDAARAYPQTKFMVLAGHTHGKFDGKITDNLHVHVGGADYGNPGLANLIDIV